MRSAVRADAMSVGRASSKSFVALALTLTNFVACSQSTFKANFSSGPTLMNCWYCLSTVPTSSCHQTDAFSLRSHISMPTLVSQSPHRVAASASEQSAKIGKLVTLVLTCSGFSVSDSLLCLFLPFKASINCCKTVVCSELDEDLGVGGL